MSNNIKHYMKKNETKPGSLISRKSKNRLLQTKNKSLTVDQVLHLQRTIGNRALNRLIRFGTIQAKLTIGKPNDVYEKEADRVADKVMSMKDGSLVNGHSSLTQRQATDEKEKEGIQNKPLADQITPLVQRETTGDEDEKVKAKLMDSKQLQREATADDKEEEKLSGVQKQENDEEKKDKLMTKRGTGNAPEVSPNIESNINEMKGGGQPLSESTRAFFEPRFGADFSQVRIHNNSKAANTAQAINAKAFTTGKNVVFNSGQYSPGTSSGKHLLAHELTHVVQQSKASSATHRLANISRETRTICQKSVCIFLTGNTNKSCRFPDEMTLSIIEDSTLVNNIIHRRGTLSGDNRGRHSIDGEVAIENENYRIFIYGQKTCGPRNYGNICVYHTIDQISLRCSRTGVWRDYTNLSEGIRELKIANVSAERYERLFPRRR